MHDNGGHAVALKWSMGERVRHGRRARSSGRRPTSAGWSATPTSSTRRSSRDAPRSSTRVSPWARPTPARSGASSPSTASTRSSRRRRRSAPSRRKTRRATHMAEHDLSRFRTLFLAGERCDPGHAPLGARTSCACPSSTTGGRRRRRWPIAANCVGLGMLPVKPGSPTSRCPGTTSACWARTTARCRPGEIGVDRPQLPLPPGCLPTLWNNDAGYVKSYLTKLSRPLPDGRRRLQGRRRLRLHHEPRRRHHQRRGPPALDRRAWRRFWPPTPTSPSARSSVSPTRSRARSPSGSSSPRRASCATRPSIVRELVESVREHDRARRRVQDRPVVKRLPKTRSGKILRGTIRRSPTAGVQPCRRRSTTPSSWTRSPRRSARKGIRRSSVRSRYARRHCHHRASAPTAARPTVPFQRNAADTPHHSETVPTMNAPIGKTPPDTHV